MTAGTQYTESFKDGTYIFEGSQRLPCGHIVSHQYLCAKHQNVTPEQHEIIKAKAHLWFDYWIGRVRDRHRCEWVSPTTPSGISQPQAPYVPPARGQFFVRQRTADELAAIK